MKKAPAPETGSVAETAWPLSVLVVKLVATGTAAKFALLVAGPLWQV